MDNQLIDSDIPKIISDFYESDTYHRLKDVFYSKSAYEIGGVQRLEKFHSSFLQWLFQDSNLPCDSKDSVITRFVSIVERRAREQGVKLSPIITQAAISRSAEITLKSAELEHPTVGVSVQNKTGYIDLLLRCSIDKGSSHKILTICIENKVDSDEHDDQTWKYWMYLAGKDELSKEITAIQKIDGKIDDSVYDYEKSGNEEQLFVFLTPISNLELSDIIGRNKKLDLCSCPKFIIINYQDIVTKILEPIMKLKDLPDRIRFIIGEYINTLSIPYIDANNKKFQIMGITKENSELLTDFWMENKKLIMAAMNAYVNDENQDEDDRENVKDAINAISRPTKYFSFNGKTKLTMKQTVCEIVRYLMEEKNYSLDKVNRVFSSIRKNTVLDQEEYDKFLSNYPSDKIKKESTRWFAQIINGENHYISTQWSFEGVRPNFPKILEMSFEGKMITEC